MSGSLSHLSCHRGQIAPVDASLVIKARVANQDIDRVELGHMAQLRVDACPYTDYGTLKGRVIEISPDSSTAQNNTSVSSTSSNPVDRSYEVTIAIDQNKLVNGRHQCQLQPGMEGSASIISREETVLQFVLRKLRLFTDL
ncbi:MAG TPA: HlyD family efflux transporter periplasmic adaptor subunit [Allocoleopsis sp.]